VDGTVEERWLSGHRYTFFTSGFAKVHLSNKELGTSLGNPKVAEISMWKPLFMGVRVDKSTQTVYRSRISIQSTAD
jgi:hypothetical protein